MIKTFKYKIYNNKKRNKKLDNILIICCQIYNHCISLHKRYYKLYKKSLNLYQLQKHITKLKKLKKYKHWNTVNSQTIQNVSERIDFGYQKFFKKQNKRTPNFKKYIKYKSFTLKQTGYKFLNNKILINKKYYKLFNDRNIEGKIKTITIKKDNLGDYYIYVTCEVQEQSNTRVKTSKTAGFDFGLKTFLTTSDEQHIKSPQYLKESLSNIKQLSRKLSKKKKGSNNRRRARFALARKYKKVNNQRLDWQFKLANNLAQLYDELYFEDLNIAGMKKLWGRKISDLSFSSFTNILEYICKREGCKLIKIDRFFPSSKLCNNCKYKYKELNLKERSWTCSNCGHTHDRDLNAAKNILEAGASAFRGEKVNLIVKDKCFSYSETNVSDATLEPHML